MHTIIRHFWFSTPRMTVYVGIDAGNVIRVTAPITRKFIGQPIRNLANWMRRQGDFFFCELPPR